MKRRVTHLVMLFLLAPLAQRTVSTVRADSSAPATPTATITPLATSTPTVLPISTAQPSALLVLRRSVRAMASVHQLHSEGIVADSPAKVLQGVHFVADCDQAAGKLRIHLGSPQPSDQSFIDFIVFRHRAWLRTTQHPAWQLDTQSNVDLLILFYYPACPIPKVTSSSGTVSNAQKLPKAHLRNVGADMVNGVPVWHLRLSTSQKGTRYSVDYFVDQTTNRWVRLVTQQTSPRYYFDAHYSHFNEPVAIPRPSVATTP